MNPGLPVYKVKKDSKNCVRILHCNMLLPLVAPEDSTNCDLEPVDLDGTDAGDDDPYVGPITRNRAKAQDPVLPWANTLMGKDTGGSPTVSSPSVYCFFDPRRSWKAFSIWFK